MIKQAVYGVATLGALMTWVFGRDVVSYATTWGGSVQQAVKREIPIDFEVARARDLVENLLPEIRGCMHVIAEQEVDLEHLVAEIARKDSELGSQKEVILSRQTDLKSGQVSFTYASQSYSADHLRTDLAKRFDRFKVSEETLKKEKQVLDVRQKALRANREKLDHMLAAKTDLELQIEQLEARMKIVQAAETVSVVSLDDSELTRAKKLIRELNKQLDVKEKVLAADNRMSDLIPVEAKSTAPKDLENQIEAYFTPKAEASGSKAELNVVKLDQLKP